MEASGAAWALRPRGTTEVVDFAGRLYRANLALLMRIMVPFALLGAAIYVVLALSAIPSGAFVRSGTLYVQAGTSTSSYTIAGDIAQVIQVLVIGALVSGAMFRTFSETIMGHRRTAGAAIRLATSRLGALVALAILVGIVVAIGTVLLVIPGIYFYVGTSVAVPVLLFEGLGPVGALGRSLDLVKGRWWATFGALLLYLVIVVILTFAIGLLFAVLHINHAAHSPTAYVLLAALTRFITQVLFAPLGAAVAASIYFDLRVRKDALDLEMIAAHLSGADPARPAVAAAGVGSGTGDPFGSGTGGPFGSG